MPAALIAVLLCLPTTDGASTLRHVRRAHERAASSAATDQDLRKELLRRRDEEQKLRHEAIEAQKKGPGPADLMKRLTDVDRANREWLKGVVDKKGWPGQALVGFDGSDAAWLLVQHADPDPAFQKQCLKLLEAAVQRKDARPTHLAYLTDRVLAGEGKKQVYGTQFTTKDGRLEPRPIEDEANVDRRRAAVGLRPLAEYRKQMEKVYGK
jgi:hypothetical protein